MYKKIACFALALAGTSTQLMSADKHSGAESHSAAASFRGYASSTDIDDTEIEASTSPLTTMSACGESDLDYTPFADFNEWEEPNFHTGIAVPAVNRLKQTSLAFYDATVIHAEAFSYLKRNQEVVIPSALLYAASLCKKETRIAELQPQAENLINTSTSAAEFLAAAIKWAAGEQVKNIIAAVIFEYARYHSLYNVKEA